MLVPRDFCKDIEDKQGVMPIDPKKGKISQIIIRITFASRVNIAVDMVDSQRVS